jgi:cyclophilin family peptidyl-prolyl cis-trans isomerase
MMTMGQACGLWVIILILTGCSGKGEKVEPGATESGGAASSTGEPSAQPEAKTESSEQSPLQQSFADATQAEPPEGSDRPPDVTMTNKSVGKIYTEVINHWNDIRFVGAHGNRIGYRADLDTEMGEIIIGLRSDLAPNHVRSFVALALAGYYDGLVFERTIHEDVEGQPDTKLDIIEAGCPLGTGEAGCGSIGYWLKPEFNPLAVHEEGTVGASHGEEGDSGACKFYINLTKAPFMDGHYTVFGKIIQGLDVARKISSLPVRNDAEYPEGDRPVKPVVIRKVTILTEDLAGASSSNVPER